METTAVIMFIKIPQDSSLKCIISKVVIYENNHKNSLSLRLKKVNEEWTRGR